MPSLRVRVNGAHVEKPEGQMLSGERSGAFDLGFTLTPPHDERSANPQERRRVLEHHRQGADRARRDQVHPAETGPPGLGAFAGDVCIGDRARRDGALDELALSAGAFKKRHSQFGPRDCERQARQAGASSKIGRVRGRRDLLELERRQ